MSLKSQALKVLGVGAVVAGLSVALVGCSGGSSDQAASTDTNAAQSQETKTIKVGASPAPHAEILNQVKDELAKEGYTLEVVEYNDYVQPNVALANGELDANYFQHVPYLENYNKENGTDLKPVAEVHFEPMAIYGGKSTDLKNVKDGAVVAVPSDATNEARALLLLQEQGLLKLKDGVGLEATPNDIAENPHNITFKEAEAASLPRLLEDADFAVINGNFALSAGLTADKILAAETAQSEAAQTYANVIVTKADQTDSEKTQALVKAVHSDAVRDYINNTYNGVVLPVF